MKLECRLEPLMRLISLSPVVYLRLFRWVTVTVGCLYLILLSVVIIAIYIFLILLLHLLMLVALLILVYYLLFICGLLLCALDKDLLDIGLDLRGEQVCKLDIQVVLGCEGPGELVGLVTLEYLNVFLLPTPDVYSDG